MPDQIKIEDAIRIEKYYPPGKNGGAKNQYIFNCINCKTGEFKIKGKSRLKTCTGLCVKCNNRSFHAKAIEARRLLPFQALFNRLLDSAKKRFIQVTIDYNDFINLISTQKCEYCFTNVNRNPSSHAYFLDRKDNNIGYTKENLVTCCSKCNKGKRELYTHEEWYGMTEYFRKKNACN